MNLDQLATDLDYWNSVAPIDAECCIDTRFIKWADDKEFFWDGIGWVKSVQPWSLRKYLERNALDGYWDIVVKPAAPTPGPTDMILKTDKATGVTLEHHPVIGQQSFRVAYPDGTSWFTNLDRAMHGFNARVAEKQPKDNTANLIQKARLYARDSKQLTTAGQKFINELCNKLETFAEPPPEQVTRTGWINLIKDSDGNTVPAYHIYATEEMAHLGLRSEKPDRTVTTLPITWKESL